MADDRIQLNDELAEDAVGGAFNWWKEPDGTRKCLVGKIGEFICTVDAKDTYAWLKAQHRGEGWTEAMYVDALLQSGDFTPVN